MSMSGMCADGCFCGPGFGDWKRAVGKSRGDRGGKRVGRRAAAAAAARAGKRENKRPSTHSTVATSSSRRLAPPPTLPCRLLGGTHTRRLSHLPVQLSVDIPCGVHDSVSSTPHPLTYHALTHTLQLSTTPTTDPNFGGDLPRSSPSIVLEPRQAAVLEVSPIITRVSPNTSVLNNGGMGGEPDATVNPSVDPDKHGRVDVFPDLPAVMVPAVVAPVEALCIICMCEDGAWFQGRMFVDSEAHTGTRTPDGGAARQTQVLLFGEEKPDMMPEDAGMDACCFEPSSSFFRVTIDDGTSPHRVLENVVKTGEDNASFESPPFSFQCASIRVDADAVSLAAKYFPTLPSSIAADSIVCTGIATLS